MTRILVLPSTSSMTIGTVIGLVALALGCFQATSDDTFGDASETGDSTSESSTTDTESSTTDTESSTTDTESSTTDTESSTDTGPGGCMSAADCAPTEYCDFADDQCGALGAGTCAPRPTECGNGFEVTGCDCNVYPGGCEAAMAGTDFKCIGVCC